MTDLVQSGCTAVWADNYDEFATIDDGSCFKNGCLEYNDCNYDSLATLDDGSCIGIPGCLDNFYVEYDSLSGCNNQSMCLTSWPEAYNLLENTYNSVEEELTYWRSPIIIDLLSGWNIIGYTLKNLKIL